MNFTQKCNFFHLSFVYFLIFHEFEFNCAKYKKETWWLESIFFFLQGWNDKALRLTYFYFYEFKYLEKKSHGGSSHKIHEN